MGRFKVYINPFDDDGNYTTWQEITEEVDSGGVGAIKQTLDNTEYDVGVFRNTGIGLALINTGGRFSEVNAPGSIFKFRRSNSKVRVTWDIMHQDLICGFFRCGMTYLSAESTLFEGLLNEDALKQQVDEQNLAFKVLGKEGIFSEVKTPYASLSIGNTFETILYTLLNQTAITNLLTVSAGNINCGNDLASDAIASLENTTVADALKSILLYSNSVLYVIDDVVYVQPRTATASVQYTFYGQGVNDHNENIIDISDFRNGLNRTFNFWTWEETALVSQDLTSIDDFGVRTKAINTDLITNTSKRQSILDALKVEFANPKRELLLRAPMDYDTVALNVLDRVRIDYPNVALSDTDTLPIWDLSEWDVAKYPLEILPVTIDENTDWKIMAKDIDTQNQEMLFSLREV